MKTHKIITYAVLASTIYLTNCSPQQRNHQIPDINSGTPKIESTQSQSQNESVLLNIKKLYTFPEMKIDNVSEKDFQKFIYEKKIDTQSCKAFLKQRLFLGKLEKIKITIRSNEGNIAFSSGNLKLAPLSCSIKNMKLKSSDTILATLALYDMFPDEKTNGFPVIFLNIWSSHNY